MHNKIVNYIDAKNGRHLYSIPFYDPDNLYEGWFYKSGDKYKTYEEYLKERDNDANQG
jgi:hypothetical protein